jgi:hypothetical protein
MLTACTAVRTVEKMPEDLEQPMVAVAAVKDPLTAVAKLEEPLERAVAWSSGSISTRNAAGAGT